MGNPLRDALGMRLHRIIDDRVAEARTKNLQRFQVFGPPERLHLGPGTKVNDALFNTVSGTITVESEAFFGHSVQVVTGTHDVRARGVARQDGVPHEGRDVRIGRGAWVSSRALVIGPCTIGPDAVVAAGAVVTGDVPAATVVAGNPARPVRSIEGGPPNSIDVETAVGRMYLHAHDEVITPDLQRSGAMADPDLALVSELAKGTVVDVGANVGYATLTAAASAERVVAVEPHPENVALLKANLARNEVGNVTVVRAAAWDGPGEIALAECRTNTGDHRVGTHIRGRQHLDVPAVRLDDVVPATADVRLIKLDTQATEHIALRGATNLINRCRPVLLAEFWPQGIRERGDDPATVLAAYAALNYARTIVEDEALNDLQDAELIERVDARPAPFGGFVTLRLDPSA